MESRGFPLFSAVWQKLVCELKCAGVSICVRQNAPSTPHPRPPVAPPSVGAPMVKNARWNRMGSSTLKIQSHGPCQREAVPPRHVDTLMDAKVAVMIAKADIARGSQADLALRHGMAIPARDLHQHARRKRFHPEHVTQRQLHRQWRHRTGLRTLKDEFFRGQDWHTFESFKADLDAYITHWNTTRRQVKSRA